MNGPFVRSRPWARVVQPASRPSAAPAASVRPLPARAMSVPASAAAASSWSLPEPPEEAQSPRAVSLGAPLTVGMDHRAGAHRGPAARPQLDGSAGASAAQPRVMDEDNTAQASRQDALSRAVGAEAEIAEAEAFSSQDERQAIFERIGRSRQQMLSIDLGTINIDDQLDRVERALAEDAHLASAASAARPPAAPVLLDDFELLAEIATLRGDDEQERGEPAGRADPPETGGEAPPEEANASEMPSPQPVEEERQDEGVREDPPSADGSGDGAAGCPEQDVGPHNASAVGADKEQE